MLNSYQYYSIGEAWFLLTILIVVSALYWWRSRNIGLSRLAVGCSGVFVVLAYCYAVIISPVSGDENWKVLIWPFNIMIGLGIVLVVYSMIKFKGNRIIHLLHMVQLPCFFFLWFLGGMTITHDWL